MWLTSVTVWLFCREGVAKSPCRCGSVSEIYREKAPGLCLLYFTIDSPSGSRYNGQTLSCKGGQFRGWDRRNRLLRGVLQNLPGISKNLQRLQTGIPGWFPGFAKGQMQNEGLLSEKGPRHLRRLRRICVL